MKFSEIYGPEWELMKGQAIPADSELLPLWGRPSVPDARGLHKSKKHSHGHMMNRNHL